VRSTVGRAATNGAASSLRDWDGLDGVAEVALAAGIVVAAHSREVEVAEAVEFVRWAPAALVAGAVRWVLHRPVGSAIGSVGSAVPADQGAEAAWSAVRGGSVRHDRPVVSDPAAALSPAQLCLIGVTRGVGWRRRTGRRVRPGRTTLTPHEWITARSARYIGDLRGQDRLRGRHHFGVGDGSGRRGARLVRSADAVDDSPASAVVCRSRRCPAAGSAARPRTGQQRNRRPRSRSAAAGRSPASAALGEDSSGSFGSVTR
jgi:hypothetical protein